MPDFALSAADHEIIASMGLAVRKRVSGFASGEQRSPARGGGIEFADYREYMAGNDVRQVDWSVYLRLRKLMVRLCAEEKELTLAVVMDASRSMDFGRPSKLAAAKRIAAVLSGIALRGGNRVGVSAIGAGLSEHLRPERSRTGLPDAVRALGRIEPQDAFAPAAAMRRFASRYGRKAVAVLISDFMYPEWPEALATFAASGCEAHVVHLLSPDEAAPALLGEITVVDSETEEEIPLVIDAPLRARYDEAFRGFVSGVQRQCARLGLGWSLASSADPMARLFKRDLAGSGIVC